MKVIFVGAGPGDPELLTLKAARLLRSCQCCIYAGSLVSPEVLALLPADSPKWDSSTMTLEETTTVCRQARDRGIDVVRKLIDGDWDTHSSRSGSAVPIAARVAAAVLGRSVLESPTVEGIFHALPSEGRALVADALAAKIRSAIIGRIGPHKPVSVVLINMAGDILGSDGDLKPWQ